MTAKHTEALTNLDSLSDLVANLKSALDEEKSNSGILRSQFKNSEEERKANAQLIDTLQDELLSRQKSENVMQERIRILDREVSELRPVIRAREDELRDLKSRLSELTNTEVLMRDRIKALESQTVELSHLKSNIADAQRKENVMRERINGMESQLKNSQSEFKSLIVKKEEESSKLRVVLQEAKEKLNRLWEENEQLKSNNNDSMKNMKNMLNDAIRSRAETDAALQESLQLLEQQKRMDIKRKGEISKLEQTVEILKSKERYLESYVSSLKNQINRGK